MRGTSVFVSVCLERIVSVAADVLRVVVARSRVEMPGPVVRDATTGFSDFFIVWGAGDDFCRDDVSVVVVPRRVAARAMSVSSLANAA